MLHFKQYPVLFCYCFILFICVNSSFPEVAISKEHKKLIEEVSKVKAEEIEKELEDKFENFKNEFDGKVGQTCISQLNKAGLQRQDLERNISLTSENILREMENVTLEVIDLTLSKVSASLQLNFSTMTADINTKIDEKTEEQKAKIIDFSRKMKEELAMEWKEFLKNISDDMSSEILPRSTGFSVLLANNFNMEDGDYVIFDHSITSIGQAFNLSTGVFSAPSDSTYMFTSSFLVDNGYCNVQLVKNEIEVARGYGANDEGLEGSGFINVILNLKKGDEVGLKMIRGWCTGYLRGNYYTSFTGFQI